VRPLWTFGAFLIACGGGGAARAPATEPVITGQLAEDDRYVPSYGKAELQRALFADRGAEATVERQVKEIEALVAAGSTAGGSDRLRVALADLAVRRRFIATLEACEAQGLWCPPRLDDPPWRFDLDSDQEPPLETTLRFDLENWRRITGELHGRACACRTVMCVDSVEVALAQLEDRPMLAVQGDVAAILSITRARECLSRLRGKKPFRIAAEPVL
jgi:hypothetical protein